MSWLLDQLDLALLGEHGIVAYDALEGCRGTDYDLHALAYWHGQTSLTGWNWP